MNVIRTHFKTYAILASFLLLFTACHSRSHLVEPDLHYTAQKRLFEKNSPDFKPLTTEEVKEEWGKELYFGIAFAKNFDFYRAITCLKRALFIMPVHLAERRMQAEFLIMQCYYLGEKYNDAIEIFEFGTIRRATSAFPAFRDLTVILYDSYRIEGQNDKAETVLLLIEKGDPETALDLKLSRALDSADFNSILSLSEKHSQPEEFSQFVQAYRYQAKSVSKAQFLNAVFPGAGYFYVGQKKTALTSLLLNTSFIAATYYFFDKGNWGAGLFTASMEFGWYFGGINGAGLAAKEYNECLYAGQGKDLMIKQSLFPVLMLQTGF